MKTKLFLSGIALFLLTIAVSAQNPDGGKKHCDKMKDTTHCMHASDSAKCNHHGKKHMQGKKEDMKGCCKEHNKNCKHFTDANKDGICNHMQDSTVKK